MHRGIIRGWIDSICTGDDCDDEKKWILLLMSRQTLKCSEKGSENNKVLEPVKKGRQKSCL